MLNLIGHRNGYLVYRYKCYNFWRIITFFYLSITLTRQFPGEIV